MSAVTDIYKACIFIQFFEILMDIVKFINVHTHNNNIIRNDNSMITNETCMTITHRYAQGTYTLVWHARLFIPVEQMFFVIKNSYNRK